MASKRQKVDVSMDDGAPASSDLISHLPADITMNILLRLPLRQAVKTSLLSRGWRYKWTTIPHLTFSHSTFSPASKLVNTTSDLLAIIHQVLFQHEGPISKFQLVVPQLRSCPELDPLISFLRRKNIEELTLIWKGNHRIPSHLFSCLKMRLLRLDGCVLKPPPDFAGFSKLKNLELCSVELPASFAESFVARCPLLERLKLFNCTNLDSVDFCAPNLAPMRGDPIGAAAIQLSKARETGDVSWEKLQSIEISHFTGGKSHMAFIELLLAKSPMLETMHIFHINGLSEGAKSIALQKINQVPRASPRARVIFLDLKLRRIV